MPVLVAGAVGFLGSHLCHALLDEGQEVLGVDSFLTGQKEHLSALSARSGFSFLEQSIAEPLRIDMPITAIYHLASPASPDDFDPLALEIIAANIQGTQNLLALAQEKEAPFLFSSTSEVYGDPLEHPQSENYWGHVNPNGPRSCYDESKRLAESLILNTHRLKGVDAKIVRIFNTYGPGMRRGDGRVIPAFLEALFRGEPLLLHGGGYQTRSFCYVADLIRGLKEVMVSSETTARVLNLGNPHEYSVRELATVLFDIAGQAPNLLEIHSPRKNDPVRRQPDISKIRNLLGWEPRVELREGLTLTYQDFKRRFS